MSSRPTKGIDMMSPHHLMIMRTLSVPLYLYYQFSLQVVLKGFVDLARRSESKSEQDVFAREGSPYRDPAKQQTLHFLVII